MKLHRLTFQAIGPFLGEHEIDFDRLSASGLFGIFGQTGAGKSTVLDAICFAFYGKVASEHSSDDRIRSGHAPGTLESYVDLIFSTPEGVFRVFRTPSWERSKKDGSGTTRQPAIGKLWKLDDVPKGDNDTPEGSVISTRLDEIGEEIQRLVGLDRKQFAQTIMLPQGEFATFLSADPEQRRGLLQRVFGTQIYEDVAKQLASMSTDAKKRVRTAENEVEVARQALAAVLSRESNEFDGLKPDVAALRGGDLIDELRAKVSSQTETLTSLSEQLAVVESEASRASLALANVVERERLRARLSELSEADVDADRQRLERSRRARQGLRHVDEAKKAKDWAASTRNAVDELTTTARDAGVAESALRNAQCLRHIADEASEQYGRLAAMEETEAALADGEAEYAQTVANRDQAKAELDEADGSLRESQRMLVQVNKTLERLPSEDLDSLQRDVDAAARVLAQARRAVGLDKELAGARRELAEAVAESHAAADREMRARDVWLSGLAGELAQTLVKDEDCPVCGSKRHPRPAALDGDHVSKDMVDELAIERRQSEKAAATVASRVEQLAAVLSEIRESISNALDSRICQDDGSHDQSSLTFDAMARSARAAHTKAVKFLEASRGASEKRAELRSRAEALQAAYDSLVERRQSLDGEYQRLAAWCKATSRQRSADERKVAKALEGRAGVSSVAEMREQLDSLRRAAILLADAVTDDSAAVEMARLAKERLYSDLTENGFRSAKSAREALLAEVDEAAIESRVNEYDSETSSARQRLSDLEKDERLVGLDVERAEERSAGTQKAADRLRAKVEALRQQLAIDEHVLAQASVAHKRLLRRVESLSQEQEDAAPIIRMAGVANAARPHNGMGLTLATYVLVRRFEDVMAAANARLVNMSDGRYELIRSDEKEDVRTMRIGLAMRVVDHLTETQRDPRTLSGGEKFYVSLCLALGLADIVSAEAGGVELGTLFIDEGFGSLDPETLDAVLAELSRLSTKGRTIGLVSHVEQLKQSISERIEVQPRADSRGSTLQIVA